MKYIIILSLLVLVSCNKKPKTIKVVSSYQYGLDIAEPSNFRSQYNVVPVEDFVPIGDFCLKKSPKITDIQPLASAKAKRDPDRYKTLYDYNITEIISWLNNLNNCNDKSDIIYIKAIELESLYYEAMRNNGYSLEVKIRANKRCNKVDTEFSSVSNKSIYKPGKLLTLGVLSEKKVQSLIAAIIALTHYEAIADIYKQIDKQCIAQTETYR